MLNSIFSNSSTGSIELLDILLISLVALVLGIIIALTHKYTSKYSKNFLTTIAILPLLIGVVNEEPP